VKLLRYALNPILSPLPDSSWENASVCNPGAWYDGDKVRLLYRAGPGTDEHPIYFGLAESNDGFNFQRVSEEPVFGPSPGNFDGGCVEDARIVRFGDTYFVTYATRCFRPGAYWKKTIPLNAHNPPLPDQTPAAAKWNLTRSALAATKDFRSFYRFGPITSATVDDRDVILFPDQVKGKFAMLHRPASWVGGTYGCSRPSIWISFSEDLLSWRGDLLLAQPAFDWECAKVGGAAPPIRTDAGWLVLYHGVDDKSVYRVGAMVLDLDNPGIILGRVPEPVLEPEQPCEREGLVPNVVFPTGNITMGNQLFVYYGAADTHCCVATAPLRELVDYVLSFPFKG